MRMVLTNGRRLRIAVGRAGTGKDQVPGPCPFHGLEQSNRPADIIVEVFLGQPGGFFDIGLGREMNHGVHLEALQGLEKRLLIPDVPEDKRSEFHPLRPAVGKIVKSDGGVPHFLEQLGRMRANVASTARNQDIHCALLRFAGLEIHRRGAEDAESAEKDHLSKCSAFSAPLLRKVLVGSASLLPPCTLFMCFRVSLWDMSNCCFEKFLFMCFGCPEGT